VKAERGPWSLVRSEGLPRALPDLLGLEALERRPLRPRSAAEGGPGLAAKKSPQGRREEGLRAHDCARSADRHGWMTFKEQVQPAPCNQRRPPGPGRPPSTTLSKTCHLCTGDHRGDGSRAPRRAVCNLGFESTLGRHTRRGRTRRLTFDFSPPQLARHTGGARPCGSSKKKKNPLIDLNFTLPYHPNRQPFLSRVRPGVAAPWSSRRHGPLQDSFSD